MVQFQQHIRWGQYWPGSFESDNSWARVSLVVVAVALTSGLLIGVPMGLVAGYFGGFIG